MLQAPGRAARPRDVDGDPGPGAGACPFCPGNEAETLPEVAAVRPGGGPPDGPGWLVRVVPNRYPMVGPDEGAHEVVVHSARHVARLADLDDAEVERAVDAWAARLAVVAADRRRLRPVLFVNEGAAAGASLRHSHAQLVGLPVEPPALAAREAAFAGAARCPVCAELADPGARLVWAADGLVAWCPRVSPLAGMLRLAPAGHAPDWAGGVDAGAVGRAVRRGAAAIGSGLGAGALNAWLHQRRPDGTGRYHWHLEMVARPVPLSGLELGAGAMAVSVAPEEVAARLRAGLPPG